LGGDPTEVESIAGAAMTEVARIKLTLFALSFRQRAGCDQRCGQSLDRQILRQGLTGHHNGVSFCSA
jgi:hypothetical protein